MLRFRVNRVNLGKQTTTIDWGEGVVSQNKHFLHSDRNLQKQVAWELTIYFWTLGYPGRIEKQLGAIQHTDIYAREEDTGEILTYCRGMPLGQSNSSNKRDDSRNNSDYRTDLPHQVRLGERYL